MKNTMLKIINDREPMLAGIALKDYLYVINYPVDEKGLCQLEMKYLFHKETKEKYFFSEKKISPSRSPYIKHSMFVRYSTDSLEECNAPRRQDIFLKSLRWFLS